MDKTFQPAQFEADLYNYWEKSGLLTPTSGKPYTILMPPPNANASLHAGHGMYAVEDIVIRYKRLRGYASLWIPGLDHAGIETQYVYEKYLAKQGKSRMDFDRQTLYNDIFKFVGENSGLIYKQFKRLGFLADWSRSVYTLDNHVIERVFQTFQKMESENLVYRDNYLVNYCTHCGTSLAELEVNHRERVDPLYYVRYPLVGSDEHIVVATVRPEPIFIDTHLAVNPKDKKRNKLIGKKVLNPLTNAQMEIIGDEFVDPKFGTGIVKLTPGHDPNDFEVAKKKGLPIRQAIDWNGRILPSGGKYAGMKVKAAREAVVKDLQEKNLIEKIDTNYLHSVSVCYKCGRDLEPMVMTNWFLRVKTLKQNVIEVVKKNKVKFYPAKYKKQMLAWLEIMHDWPISRQNVWGIRIPVWYKVEKNSNIWISWIDKDKKLQQGTVGQFLAKGISLPEIEKGLQRVYTETWMPNLKYTVSQEKPKGDYLPETDTFDTWFSSGQWPLVTIKEDEYKTRFPTDLMGTLVDILKFWISRMIMFSLYVKKEVPFKTVYLWPMVADAKGLKMSKSRGNVVNPIDLVDKYGADAFRASLLFGIAAGGKVIMSEDKVRGMRNFTNKVWNIGRFIEMNKSKTLNVKRETATSVIARSETTKQSINKIATTPLESRNDVVLNLNKELIQLKKKYILHMDKFQFSTALGIVYEFLWHRFADYYIEQLKDEVANDNIKAYQALEGTYLESLKMLHPFMPFVTEAAFKVFKGSNESILQTSF